MHDDSGRPKAWGDDHHQRRPRVVPDQSPHAGRADGAGFWRPLKTMWGTKTHSDPFNRGERRARRVIHKDYLTVIQSRFPILWANEWNIYVDFNQTNRDLSLRTLRSPRLNGSEMNPHISAGNNPYPVQEARDPHTENRDLWLTRHKSPTTSGRRSVVDSPSTPRRAGSIRPMPAHFRWPHLAWPFRSMPTTSRSWFDTPSTMPFR